MDTRHEIMSHRESCAPREVRLACRACAVLREHFPKLCVGTNTFGAGDETVTQTVAQTVHETTPSPEGRVVLTESAFVDHSWMDDPDLLFVSFIGFLRGHDPFGPARWQCDQNMCEELLTMTPTVYSYISVPTNDGRADWFNLVLFKDPGFLQTFEESLFHRHAIEFLSPDSFSHICVRSGTWHGGVGPRGRAQVHKSVMLSYQKEAKEDGSNHSQEAETSNSHRLLRNGVRVQRCVFHVSAKRAAKL